MPTSDLRRLTQPAYPTVMHDCIVCRILAGDEPGTFVYRDQHCAAFMDIQPVNRGHILVVPIHHASYLADLHVESARLMMQVAQQLAAALRASRLQCEGVNLFLADGEAAGQEIFHSHLHVIPRFQGDGFGLRFRPNYHTLPLRVDLEQAAAQIRRAFYPALPPPDADV
jgi:histidine triad (HIT) family protein